MRNIKFDTHCHIFDSDILNTGSRLLVKLLHLDNLVNLLDYTKIDKNFVEKIKDIAEFLDICSKDSKDIFLDIQTRYPEKLALVPLMADFTFAAAKNDTHENDFFKKIESFVNKIFNHYHNSKGKQSIENQNLIKELDTHWTKFSRSYNHYSNKKSRIPNVFSKNGFERQKKELEEIKSTPEYKDFIYPFLMLDPRHQRKNNFNIMEMVRATFPNGKCNKFAGIKLYTPMGYSPTDPILFDKNGVYDFCQTHNIPITIHSSCGGFATLLNEVKVTGKIYDNKQDKVYDFDGTYKFKTTIIHHKLEAIEERGSVLNHPKIWKFVMEKYKNLKINFAHFGNDVQIMNYINYYLDKKEKPKNINTDYSWTQTILELLEYKNTYSDFSSFIDDGVNAKLSELKTKIYDAQPAQIKAKFLYGSDYYISLFFDANLKNYYENFKNVFGNQFDNIAIINPNKFLFENNPVVESESKFIKWLKSFSFFKKLFFRKSYT